MELVNTDIAYKFIRERILNGSYSAGMPLASKNLSKEIGVSRTPVRDALRQLEADGLVTIKPRIGASVKSMELQEFKELCGLRQALETYAAGLAAQNRSEAELEEIRSALEAMRVIVDKMVKTDNDNLLLGDLAREDVRFHLAIINVAKNELMKKEIMRLSLINRVVSSHPPGKKRETIANRRKVFESHLEIFDAIARKNISAAKDAMERHQQNNLEKVIQLMGNKEQSKFHSDLGIAATR
ncbi:MAG: transcriptional regulator, GntR family [Verrucomicrobia bacterium]|nr:transcriptional regulator, GntR family [Verrucomicrobiota bacterium]